ncbi:MAG: carboxypeptidase regulatory-like domain-containing protein [Archangium sp.]|nr:carboxypeptidase regulatory-like domain-containing protein [Archangium sp.]
MNIRIVVGALLISGCLELSLPPSPPPPGPGTVQGTLKYSQPGRSGLLAAKNGHVVLLGNANEARTDDEGRFALGGITEATGSLRLFVDLDGDGAIDRQRVMTLESIGAGPGRDLALGEVVLGRNARLSGRVLRGDLTQDAFHLGTTVFVTGMEYSTFSADNGGYVLDALPEGPMQIAFVRNGYLPETRDVVLEAGEDKRLTDVRLVANPSGAATATGKVVSSAGPIGQARVRAVSSEGAVAVNTADDGTFKLGPMPSGAWLIGVEAQGFKSVSLGRQLLNPGANDLRTVTLITGTSMPLDLDAGLPPPQPDAGADRDAGTPDAGQLDAGSGGGAAGGAAGGSSGGSAGGSSGGSAGGLAGGSAGGAVAGGSGGGAGGGSAGGAVGGGSTDGGAADAGAPLGCGGACSAGFFCSSGVQCQTASCGLTSCGGACNDGRCYASSCGAQTCGIGEVCDQSTCRPLACAGVTCGAGAQCAAGRCLSQLCRYGTCAPGSVCVNATCVDVRCVDVDCGPAATCFAGVCLPTTSQAGSPCAPGFVFVGGRCTDVACQGLTCPAGSVCRVGQCNPSGLYIAGLLYPEGRTNLTPETVIATLGPTGWQRLNVTALPPVAQLSVSPSGQWLFAITDDVPNNGSVEGSLWRSADGIGWTKVFDGSNVNASGALNSMTWELATNTLLVTINGGPSNSLNGSLFSTDDGTTWRRRVFTFGGDYVTSVSPDLTAVPFSNFGWAGLYPNDGGTRLPHFYNAGWTRLFVDQSGSGPSIVATSDLRLLSDGGLLAPVTVASQDSVVYGPGTRLFATSANAVWFSLDNGVAWGQRALPIIPTVSLVGVTRGANDALIVGNKTAQPPLLVSSDDGLTWSQLGNDWYAIAELSDPVPAWQPDSGYVWEQRVRPRVPNGWVYQRYVGGSAVSGPVEPAWTTDGGDVREPNTDIWWRPAQPHLGVRVTAMTSLRCCTGQMRCGGACVDISSSTANCGACGRTCAGTCRNGACEATDAGALQSGCADGTREGFVDDVAWPDIAACRGSWSGDLSAAADSVCGAGFHVCTNTDSELATVRTSDALAFPGCFAYRASNDGFDGCEPLVCQGDPTRDDMAGMGRGCLLVSGVSRAPSTIPDGGSSCLFDRGRIDAQCCAVSVSVPGSSRSPGCPQRTEDGVVCCRN